ncbi:MAG TPA: hypothetical protein VI911_09825 [Patescibacteria group bacterium]|nr:hypothetical protein [Patescibacteria group bacterium]
MVITSMDQDTTFGEAFLCRILEWVREHVSIEDIWSSEEIKCQISRDISDPSKVYAEEDLMDWVRMNYNPKDVFPELELETWAESHGFVKKDGSE